MSDKNSLLNDKGFTEEEFLKQYNPDKYPKPSVAVDILLFTIISEEEQNYRKLPEKELKLLLVRRKDHPFINQWALPGGFSNIDEGLDDAAVRELKEETNIDKAYIEQLYTFGDVDRDPRTRVISCSYLSLVDSQELILKAGDDAAEAKWFTVRQNILKEQKTNTEDGYILEKTVSLSLLDENDNPSAIIQTIKTQKGNSYKIEGKIVESHNIAFDHAKIIQYGLERLRNKIEYTDIAFNLMPGLFTLTELQRVYEVILGRELLAANFRRKISKMVIETNNYKKDAGHRPSKLYRFNSNWEDDF